MSDDAPIRPPTKEGVRRAEPLARRNFPKHPAAPVIALRRETLLCWVTLRVAKFPRDHCGSFRAERAACRGERPNSPSGTA